MLSAQADSSGLEARIACLAAQLDAATHELLTLIRRFDDCAGWSGVGMVSCAHWLSWRIGLAPGAAREKVRVARALGNLPLIDEALARGEVSFSKVRAMTRIATRTNEERLLYMARNATAAQLERICRSVRILQGRDLPSERFVYCRPRPNGLVRLEAELLPDEAALVMAMIDARRRVSAETGETLNRADALVRIAEENGAPSGERLERPRIVMHFSPAVLADGYQAELDDGTAVSAETFRRVACDAGIDAVLTDLGGHPLSVGRRTRVIPASMRRMLEARDRGCRFPGCTHKRFIHGHHIEHWMDGGQTAIDNLVLLCSQHHRLVHEEGFGVECGETGVLSFYTSDARLIVDAPRPTPVVVPLPRTAGIDHTSGLLESYTHRPGYSECAVALTG